MNEITTEELREIQMCILDYVDAFCRIHHINYTISGGTLLGAIRHGGYIPWDDDLDIQMLRSEYNRFTELWNKEKSNHGNYELVNIESGNNMGYPFGKVHDLRTITYIGKLKRTGVYIDVFPVDNVEDMEDFNMRHQKILDLYKKRGLILHKMRQKIEPFQFKRWLYLLFSHMPSETYEEIAEKINTLASNKSDITCPLVYEMIAGTKCKNPIPKKVFDNYVDIKFENRTFRAVEDYDTYLTLTFGDYMTPPPHKERGKHLFKPYWI